MKIVIKTSDLNAGLQFKHAVTNRDQWVGWSNGLSFQGHGRTMSGRNIVVRTDFDDVTGAGEGFIEIEAPGSKGGIVYQILDEIGVLPDLEEKTPVDGPKSAARVEIEIDGKIAKWEFEHPVAGTEKGVYRWDLDLLPIED